MKHSLRIAPVITATIRIPRTAASKATAIRIVRWTAEIVLEAILRIITGAMCTAREHIWKSQLNVALKKEGILLKTS